MSPRIARALLLELRESPAPTPDPLSPRERQLLKLVDEGLTYKQISDRLHVSAHTVHSHIKNIYEALHAKSSGRGVKNMRSRAEELGGSLVVTGEPVRQLTVSLPL